MESRKRLTKKCRRPRNPCRLVMRTAEERRLQVEANPRAERPQEVRLREVHRREGNLQEEIPREKIVPHQRRTRRTIQIDQAIHLGRGPAESWNAKSGDAVSGKLRRPGSTRNGVLRECNATGSAALRRQGRKLRRRSS